MKLLASVIAVHLEAWTQTAELLAGALIRTARARNAEARAQVGRQSVGHVWNIIGAHRRLARTDLERRRHAESQDG